MGKMEAAEEVSDVMWEGLNPLFLVMEMEERYKVKEGRQSLEVGIGKKKKKKKNQFTSIATRKDIVLKAL